MSLTGALALNRTVGVVLVSVLFFGLGEQLWNPFFPAYLQAKLGMGHAMAGVSVAALLAVGVYACLRNLFEAVCYVGGGQLTARLGDRGSLILFGVLTVAGYALFLVWGGPAGAIIATLLIVGWEPLSVPVTFTTVGATVTKSSQGMAFALQSIQKRLPKIVGPLVAGVVLAAAAAHSGSREIGYVVGMRWLVAVSLLLGLASLGLQLRWMPHHEPPPPGPGARAVVRQFPPPLRRLLLAEVFTRWCDWLVREFVVLYLLGTRGVDAATVGLLFALQNVTALLTYLPVGRMTAVVGLQPFIGLTFIFFALFPLSLAVAPDGWGVVAAFTSMGCARSASRRARRSSPRWCRRTSAPRAWACTGASAAWRSAGLRWWARSCGRGWDPRRSSTWPSCSGPPEPRSTMPSPANPAPRLAR